MILQTLFFLVDIEFFDVINHLLLQSVAVVFHANQFLQAIDDAGADFLHTRSFVRFDAHQQLLNVVHLLIELGLKGGTLLCAEFLQLVDCVGDGTESHLPFLIAEHFHLHTRHRVGQTEQRRHPFCRA